MDDATLRYQCALEAALVILEGSDFSPSEPKHLRLSRTIFSVIDAIRRYEQEREASRVSAFSLN